MSVLRQLNVLGQQRLDVPHLRSIESSIAADFDVVAGRVTAGSKAVVIRGFTLANYTAGTSATSVQLSTADGIVYNINSSESGTFLWVPADRAVEVLNSATNSRVQGGFTAGQTNYVGIDLIRTADDTTSDLVQFLDPNTLLEQPKSVPLARTLDYRIVISTTPFSASPNIIPIAKIVTDAQNQISSASNSVQDARNGLFRLGTGGDFPNTYGSFTWPQNRLEYDPNVSALSALDHFTGGDKGVRSQKDWMDGVMTRLWELGGGQNWYSPTTGASNVKMVKDPGVTFVSNGDNFEWGAEGGVLALGLYGVKHLHWKGLKIAFENANVSGVYYNAIQDQTSDDPAGSAATSKTALDVGDCIYVDVDRTSNASVIAKKAKIQTLGSPTIPGSRIILAWRETLDYIFTRDAQYAVNQSFVAATTVAIGAVRLSYVAGVPGAPTVPPLDANNTITIGGVGYTIIGNNSALVLTGGGTAAGITSTGGGSSGAGGTFTGGAANGRGVNANGVGTGAGIAATSSGTGPGVLATSTSGVGTDTTGGPNQAGLKASGGTGNSNAVESTAVGTGKAFKSILGDAELPATNKYTFATTRTRALHISASQFIRDVGGTDWQNADATKAMLRADPQAYRSASWFTGGSRPGQTGKLAIKAGIHLPHGAAITSFQVLYTVDYGGTAVSTNPGDVYVELIKRTYSGGVITATVLNSTKTIAIGAGSGNSFTVESGTIAAAETVDNVNAWYEMAIDVTAQWNNSVPVAAIPGGSEAALITMRDGRILVTGGVTAGTSSALCRIFDPLSGEMVSVASMNHARARHHGYCHANGKIVVFGGHTGNGTTAMATCEAYDPLANTWTDIGTIGNALQHSWIVRPDGRGAIIVGGTAGNQKVASVVSDSFAGALTSTNANRTGTALVWAMNNDKHVLLAFGGGTDLTTGSATNTFEVYDPVADTWTTGTGTMVTARNNAQAAQYYGGNVLKVWGGNAGEGGAVVADDHLQFSGTTINNAAENPGTTAPATITDGTVLYGPRGEIFSIPGNSGGSIRTTRFRYSAASTSSLGTWETMGTAGSAYSSARGAVNPSGQCCITGDGLVAFTYAGNRIGILDTTLGNTQQGDAVYRRPNLRIHGVRINYTYTEVNPEM